MLTHESLVKVSSYMNKTTEPCYSKFRVLFKNLVHRSSIRLYGSYEVLKEVQNHLPAPGSLGKRSL